MLPMEEGQIMGMELIDAEVEPYQTDGFVVRKALIDGVEVAYLRQCRDNMRCSIAL
jgi:hypothetical protein